jgi:hypothetical protein
MRRAPQTVLMQIGHWWKTVACGSYGRFHVCNGARRQAEDGRSAALIGQTMDFACSATRELPIACAPPFEQLKPSGAP